MAGLIQQVPHDPPCRLPHHARAIFEQAARPVFSLDVLEEVMSYPTTRTYPRNLGQAFADERAVCVYLPPKRYADKAVNWALAVAVIVIVLSVAFGGPAV